MSRIIQPMGLVTRQVLIEMDDKGVTSVKAFHIVMGKQSPMLPLEFSSMLAQPVSSTLQAILRPQKQATLKTGVREAQGLVSPQQGENGAE